jgi:uncharacterized repeat protein (TIGR01451 family)
MITHKLTAFAVLARRCVAPALVVTACSCSSVRPQMAKTEGDPFLANDLPAAQVATRDSRPESKAGPVRRSAVQPAGLNQVESPEDGRVTLAGGFREVTPRQPAGAASALPARSSAGVVPTGWQSNSLPQYCPPPTGTGAGGTITAPWGASGDAAELSPDAMVRQFPDEYLFDGGDRGYPVHYDDLFMRGLESEDTVAEYVDEDGRRKVMPTNRVAVYSPRFAAVTSVSAPLEDVSQNMLSEAAHHVPGMAMRSREATFAHHQRDRGEGLLTRSRASGVAVQRFATEVHNPVAFDGHVHTTVVMEDLNFMHTGQMSKADEARLAASIDSAGTWTRTLNPAITAKSDGAGELHSKFDVQEMVGREDRNKPGKLRIVKLADRKIAAPGEIVKFTIRFDNLGDRPVREVVISDNLTPRLEYVDDSATCDRDGRLIVVENGEGSVILRWELDEPLPGRTGGVATFQAKVR